MDIKNSRTLLRLVPYLGREERDIDFGAIGMRPIDIEGNFFDTYINPHSTKPWIRPEIVVLDETSLSLYALRFPDGRLRQVTRLYDRHRLFPRINHTFMGELRELSSWNQDDDYGEKMSIYDLQFDVETAFPKMWVSSIAQASVGTRIVFTRGVVQAEVTADLVNKQLFSYKASFMQGLCVEVRIFTDPLLNKDLDWREAWQKKLVKERLARRYEKDGLVPSRAFTIVLPDVDSVVELRARLQMKDLDSIDTEGIYNRLDIPIPEGMDPEESTNYIKVLLWGPITEQTPSPIGA